jgi:putative endonuclease
MICHVYILQSLTSGRYYIGHAQNPDIRAEDHNQGKTKSTRNKGPWQIIYTEQCPSKSAAMKRERQIKSYKGDNAFKKLIAR